MLPSCKKLFVILQLKRSRKKDQEGKIKKDKEERYMKLSELKTGESGVIVKVSGHGGFRKRVIEMGFIKGKKVDVLLNAPLQDPVKYKIMGYEVSLRHSEADSRYWGFVPEDHIVGKPIFIWWSHSPDHPGFSGIRWNRLFTFVDNIK